MGLDVLADNYLQLENREPVGTLSEMMVLGYTL